MMPSILEMELLRFMRKPSRVDAILFTPHEIDLSRLRSRAYEDAIVGVVGAPALAFEAASRPRTVISTGKLRPSISRDVRPDELEIGSTIPYIKEKPFLGSVNGRDPRGLKRRT